MKYSILTPAFIGTEQRRNQLYRAINSVQNQTVKDFEHIVINDGSTLEVKIPKSIKLINQPHLERIVAYYNGMKEAKGDWFAFLDSDDEYVSYYLEACDAMMKKFPEAKMFNFGSIHITKDYKALPRGPFRPPKLDVGHEVFGGGVIVNGTFIFHRSIYEELGGYPAPEVHKVDCKDINYPDKDGNMVRTLGSSSPWDFAAFYQVKYPEIRKFFSHETETWKAIRELGNPFGQDYILFYSYTRKYHSEPFDCNLYIAHPGQGGNHSL
jgi:glycosyltransferase involved in cell wall biosynthesis